MRTRRGWRGRAGQDEWQDCLLCPTSPALWGDVIVKRAIQNIFERFSEKLRRRCYKLRPPLQRRRAGHGQGHGRRGGPSGRISVSKEGGGGCWLGTGPRCYAAASRASCPTSPRTSHRRTPCVNAPDMHTTRLSAAPVALPGDTLVAFAHLPGVPQPVIFICLGRHYTSPHTPRPYSPLQPGPCLEVGCCISRVAPFRPRGASLVRKAYTGWSKVE